jgi:alpha-tubulin suppressor-like RCC1 family protein
MPLKIFRWTLSIISAVSIAAFMYVCSKQPADLARNNPCDPGGLDWHPPAVTVTKNDTTVSINDSITVTATGTDNGKVMKYVWTKNGTTYSDTTDSGSLKVAWPDIGRKVVRVKAMDNDGVVSTPDSCIVTVLLDPPVPNAGQDTTVSINDTIRLHGSATDGFGHITSWAWDIGNTGIFTTTSGSDTAIIAPASENLNYRCILQVTDDDGNMVKDTVRIIVRQDNPVPNAGPDTTVSINDTVRLHGSATDGFGYITSMAWDIGNTGTFTLTATGDTAFIAPASENQNYLCVLRATDDDGNMAKDTIKIVVLQDVPIANAGNDTAAYINDTMLLHGSATQQFGSIVKWEWNIGSGGWTATGGSDTMAIMPTTEQTVICSLAVTDDDGNRTVDGIKIAVFKDKVISVSAGWYHSLILKSDSTLWACGYNNYGQLGNGTNTTSLTPVQVMSSVQSMAAGGNHSLFLKTDGTLWACGYNSFGQLGDGTTMIRYTPVQVMSSVKSVSAGWSHSLILKSDSTLWACGYNYYGQLGDGTTTDRHSPVQVMSGVQSVAAGGGYSLILKSDGTLWACGYNYYGNLGDGTTTNRSTPVQVMSGVQSVATGGGYSLILKSDGTLWACGYNYYGQLGDGTTANWYTPVQVMSNVQSITAGGAHSLILKSDGTLWACGYNHYGQLGDGTTAQHLTPVQVMSGVRSAAAGYYFSLILKTDGTLWACGYNSDGEFGDGTTTDRHAPIRVIPPQQ